MVFKYILLGIICYIVAHIVIYSLSKMQMRAWLKAIDEHFQIKFNKIKKDGNEKEK